MCVTDDYQDEYSGWLSDATGRLSSNMIHLVKEWVGVSKLGNTVIASLVSASSLLYYLLTSDI